MAPEDLSEYIDDVTLDTVQYNVNKALKAKAKRDDAKAPTKNEIRVKKNTASKRSYHSMDKQIIDKLNTKKRIKQRDVRAELDKKPAAKRVSLDRRNQHRAKAVASTKFAMRHNAVYPSNMDRLAETQREKDGTLVMGKLCKNSSFVPSRVLTIASGIPFIHEPLGSVTGNGFYQAITTGDFGKLFNAVLKLMPIDRVQFLSTLDLGSGLGLPSLYFSQYISEFGVHFGIEYQAGLVHNVRCNLKNVAAKGLNNIRQGHLSSSNIEKNGELQYVVPPNCISIEGDIMDIVDPNPNLLLMILRNMDSRTLCGWTLSVVN